MRFLRRPELSFLLFIIALSAARGAQLFCSPGGEDEECYAIPGWTVLQTGIPQLPTAPSRDEISIFYRADEVLFAEPPLLFYVQAACFAVLPPTYGTARMATLLGGLGYLLAVWWLTHRVTGSTLAAWIAGVALALSRCYLFASLRARPDLLCSAFGVAAVCTIWKFRETQRSRWLALSGVLIGLGGLTHAFALVYAAQLGLAAWWLGQGRTRWTNFLFITCAALGTAAIWSLLILQWPDVWWIQMRNQYLQPGETSLFMRVVWPWAALKYHGRHVWEYFHPAQCILPVTAVVIAGIWSARRREAGLRFICLLSVTGVWWLAALLGDHHRIAGYWTYPLGLASATVGWLAVKGIQLAHDRGVSSVWSSGGLTLALLAIFLPGGGWRSALTYWRNSGETDYNAPHFAQQLMGELPADARLLVGPEYALDFVVANRSARMASPFQNYYRTGPEDYDLLVLGRPLRDTRDQNRRLLDLYRATPDREFGRSDDELACYAVICRPAEATPAED